MTGQLRVLKVAWSRLRPRDLDSLSKHRVISYSENTFGDKHSVKFQLGTLSTTSRLAAIRKPSTGENDCEVGEVHCVFVCSEELMVSRGVNNESKSCNDPGLCSKSKVIIAGDLALWCTQCAVEYVQRGRWIPAILKNQLLV